MSEEDIAAAFFVSASVVKQRLKLASVSPQLLDIYAEDGMTLDQLMAFTVNPDHGRQESVWEALQRSHSKEPYHIRRLLTEGAVRASDKRAQFVGIDAYQAAGGSVMRDLFQQDDGGWLQDPALLDHLVTEKLARETDAIRAEGWKWVEVASDFPYGHTFGLRHLGGVPATLSDEETSTKEALQAEYDQLEQTYAEAEELPDDADQRLGEIETALAAFENRPALYNPEDMARAGAFVSVDGSGTLRIERGYVRLEDEPVVPEPNSEPDAIDDSADSSDAVEAGGTVAEPAEEPEEDDLKQLPDRLMTELTAHRTLALRHALGENPDMAFMAALHVLCLKLFYRYAVESCLEIEPKSVVFGAQAPGLNDTAIARAVDDRHRAWAAKLPREPGELWEALLGFDHDSRMDLFAHCVALTVNAVHEPWNRRPRALAHADRLAEATDLDMTASGWTPTVDKYFGRVTKARILEAVREACGEHAAERIEHLKKGEMAQKAEELLVGTGWLPEPLRTPGRALAISSEEAEAATDPEIDIVETTADGGETAMAQSGLSGNNHLAAIEPNALTTL